MNKILFLFGLLLVQCHSVAQVPTITTFAPASGAIGSSVMLTGTGFNTTTSQNIVFFGATRATVIAASATSLTVTVPLGATYQYLSITNLAVNLTAYSSKPFIVTLTGAIAFANKQDFTGAGNPTSVALGDLNADGKTDIVVCTQSGNSISVLLNTSVAGLVSFADKVDFFSGSFASNASIGDIDGDGKLDIAVTNANGDSLSIFLNTTSLGTFGLATPVVFATGSGPNSVSIGDIDGNGKPDLVVANVNGNRVAVFRNTSSPGTVSFAARVDIITSTGPFTVEIGDMDGNGKVDLVVTNSGSNTVSVFRSTSVSGTISFAAKVDFATGASPRSLKIGDIDGDGKPDMVVANYIGNTVSLFRGTSVSGTISFVAKVDFAATSPHSLSLGDINGDGKPDIVVTNNVNDIASVFRNTSILGTFSLAIKIDLVTGSVPYPVSIGDIDGDGKPDIVVGNGNSALVSVFRQIASPTITTFFPANGPIGTTVTLTGTEFNPIANQNIVFFGATKATVISATYSSLSVTVPLGATYQNISVTNLAVALTGYSAKPFTVTFNGAIAFANKTDYTTVATPMSVSVGDIDGDGKGDLVIANSGLATISVMRNTSTSGTVSFAPRVDIASGGGNLSISIGDFNSDGKPDLVAVNSNNTISVFRNTSTTGTISLAAKVDFATGLSPRSVCINDIDRDGKPDIAVTNSGTNTVSVLRNTTLVPASIVFVAKVDFVVGNSPYSIKSGDIDGDGKPDLVTANYGSSTVSVLRNTSVSGTVSFAAKVDYISGSGSTSLSVGDIDGDGKSDIVVNSESNNNVGVLRNTSVSGTVGFASKVDFTAGSAPGTVTIGDIDGDGKPDLAIGNYSSLTASVLQNTSTVGTVNFADKIDFTCGQGTYTIDIGDIDGNGKPDLAVINNGANTFSILRQLDLPQGSLSANGSFCTSGTGQLTFTATAGLGPFTLVYNDGTANRTVTGVVSGTPFNVFTNPVSSTTNYTLVSVSYSNNAIRTSGFTGTSATITVNAIITPVFAAVNAICSGGSLSALPTTSNNGITGTWSPALNNTTTTTYTFTPTLGECAITTDLTITVGCYLAINLKLYIEGYYDTGTSTMRSVKFNQGVSASTTDVETITVALHHAVNFGLLETATANLQTDGSAVFTFTNTVHGSYYVVVKGRNLIESWSGLPQSIGSTPLSYDFTSSASQAYGNNMVEVEAGVWALYSGDVNQDGNIDTIDYPILEVAFNNFLSGDYATDLNGDGNVDTIDYPIFEINANNFVSRLKP